MSGPEVFEWAQQLSAGSFKSVEEPPFSVLAMKKKREESEPPVVVIGEKSSNRGRTFTFSTEKDVKSQSSSLTGGNYGGIPSLIGPAKIDSQFIFVPVHERFFFSFLFGNYFFFFLISVFSVRKEVVFYANALYFDKLNFVVVPQDSYCPNKKREEEEIEEIREKRRRLSESDRRGKMEVESEVETDDE